MKLLKNIKKNYFIKLIEDLIEKKNYSQLSKEIINIKKKYPDIYFSIFPQYINKLLQNLHYENFMNKNLIWLNSYDVSDLDIITQFLNYYLNYLNKKNFMFVSFNDEISSILKKYKFRDKKFLLTNLLELNEFIQFEISQKDCEVNFIKTNQAFYEHSASNKFFLYNNITSCYFYIIRNPINAFIKTLKDDPPFENSRKMFNYNQESNLKIYDNIEIEDGSQSWNVNVKSWTNENVKNTFNGLIIKYEDFISNSLEVFANIVTHLNQVGYKLDINYDLINQFINENKKFFVDKIIDHDISKKKLKILKREFGDLAQKYGYF